MNTRGAQWDGGTFILRYTSLKMGILLHKITLANFPMAATVMGNFSIHYFIGFVFKLTLCNNKRNTKQLKIQWPLKTK